LQAATKSLETLTMQHEEVVLIGSEFVPPSVKNSYFLSLGRQKQ
jgi:hypothetical protein